MLTPMGDEDDFDGMAESTRAFSIQDLDLGLADMSNGPGHVDPLPPGPKAMLECVEGRGRGQSLMITKPLMMLGRIPNVADLVVDDDHCSRHHAAIGHTAGTFTLYDMGSTNGTFVNDQKITEHPLADGDRIGLGDSVLVFRPPGGGSDHEDLGDL